jgi:hypothetical protein
MLRRALVGILIVGAFFGGTLWILESFFPQNSMADRRPMLITLPRLMPVTRNSVIVAPVAVANLAIRDAMEAHAPRALNGKRDNPLSDLLGKADIGWNVTRGPLAVAGTPSGLAISTTLNGSLRVVGQVANQTGNLAGAVSGLLGDSVGRDVQKLTTRMLDQRADIRGNVTVTAQPALSTNWRIEPHLAGRVALADGGMTVAGIKLNVSNEVKPLLDRPSTSRSPTSPTGCAATARWSWRRGANGPRSAARSRLARRRPAPPSCGSKCARPGRSRRSRAPSPTG